MNRNNFWRFIIVIVVLLICFSWIYPPTSSDLLAKFQERAVKTDTNFVAIVERARALQRTMPEKSYDNLRSAIGTNDITRYFPFYEATNQLNPSSFVLMQLQREAAGKIKLGIDLKWLADVMEASSGRNVATKDIEGFRSVYKYNAQTPKSLKAVIDICRKDLVLGQALAKQLNVFTPTLDALASGNKAVSYEDILATWRAVAEDKDMVG